MNLDDGRWRAENNGKPVDDYFLRSKLKGYVVTKGEWEGVAMPPRQWRAHGRGSPNKRGYHELHFADAFLRYLGRGLPSKSSAGRVKDEETRRRSHPPNLLFSPSVPPESGTSAAHDVSPDKSTSYGAADGAVDADGVSGATPSLDGAVDVSRMAYPHPLHHPGHEKAEQLENVNPGAADVPDERGAQRKKEKNEERPFPCGSAGRKRKRER